MTLLHRRSREPALSGDFPDDGDAVTEVLSRVPDWDARTIAFTGAQAVGIAPASLYRQHTGLGPLTAPPPPRPRRTAPDCAIIVLIPGGWGILCSMCRWRRHADPEALSSPELRWSAELAGWRKDAFGGWCCPTCKETPRYRASGPLAHWHPDGARARGCVVQTEDGLRDAELWARAIAEHDLIRDVRAAAGHGRHRAGTR